MPKGKRPLGRHRCRWQDTVKVCCKERGWSGMYWVHLAPDRAQWRSIVNMVMKFCVPFSRRTQLHGDSKNYPSHNILIVLRTGILKNYVVWYIKNCFETSHVAMFYCTLCQKFIHEI
jgi:hypothetical protein